MKSPVIAYISDGFPRVSETFVSNEIIALLRLGYDVKIFSLRNPGEALIHPSAQALLDRTIYLPHPVPRDKVMSSLAALALRAPSRTIRTLSYAKTLPPPHYVWTARQAACYAGFLIDQKCSHIHAHFAGEAARFALMIAQYTGITFTVTIHGPTDFHQPRGTIDVIAEKAKAIITVSDFNKTLMIEKYGVDPDKIHVNPNGVDPTLFSPGPPDRRRPGRIVTVARLHENKGLTHAIEAAAIMRDQGVIFEWAIIGEGEERGALERQIKDLSLQNNMFLLGAQPADRVLEELRTASVFALPSLSEGQPVVYLEAMATATPVVGTDIVGISKTVLDGITGFLVPPAAPHPLASRLIELLRDPDLRLRMGQAGHRRVLDHYNLADRVKDLIQHFES